MRSGIIGFVLGAILVVAILQQIIIREVAPSLSYHFNDYILDGPDFPQGDFEQGRLVHRALFPARVNTTFYDAQYNVVTRADKPGRYGAVVRMSFTGGVVEYRYITLYRTPVKIYWWEGHMPLSIQWPSDTGIDPAVYQIQAREIAEIIDDRGVYDTPHLAILLAGLSETSRTDPPAVWRTDVTARDSAWWYGLRQRLGLAEKYNYLVDLPANYDADPAKRWPLILYLHSAAEYGGNIELVRESGLAGQIHKGRQVPAVVVSPQSPSSEGWDSQVLSQLLDEVSAKYRIDPDRIYLTGASAGGDGTWKLALAYPDRFAAIIPIAGEGDSADAARLKDIPVWAFRGEKDDVIPASQETDMINAIAAAGGHAHLTIIPNAPHGVWDQVYSTDSVFTWLFAQKRGQPEVLTPGLPTP
jgi:pimeloyl-ACP methyl ester carboxylesterase